MPNITTNHAINYTNMTTRLSGHFFIFGFVFFVFKSLLGIARQ